MNMMEVSIKKESQIGRHSIILEISKSGLWFSIWRNEAIILSGNRSDLHSIKELIDKILSSLPEIEQKFKETQ